DWSSDVCSSDLGLFILQQRIQSTAGHQAEIRVIEYEIDPHLPHQMVITLGAETFEESVGRALGAHTINDVIAFMEFIDHILNVGRIVLQVCINTDNKVFYRG